MIVDGILNLFYSILEPLIGLLPDGEFPVEAGGGEGLTLWLAKLDYLFPFIAPLSFIVGVGAATALVFLAYRFGIFLFNKVRGA